MSKKAMVLFDGTVRTTDVIADNISVYETIPMDGMLIDCYVQHPLVGNVSFQNHFWSGTAFPYVALSSALNDLKTIPFVRLNHNFLRVITQLATAYGERFVDWYDKGILSLVHNFRMAARLARDGYLRGVFFDPEPSGGTVGNKIWNYSDRPFKNTYTFAQYQARVRLVASWIGEAMMQEFPNMEFLMLFMYEQTVKNNNPPLSDDRYGLYEAFISGIFDAVDDPFNVTNMYEDGYAHYASVKWDEANSVMSTPQNCNSKRYYSLYQKGHSTFIDYPASAVFDTTTPTNNYYDTSNIQTAITGSMTNVVEKYKNMYTEDLRFTGGTVPLVYLQAICTARETLGIDYAFDPTKIGNLVSYFNPVDIALTNGASISSYTDGQGNVWAQTGGARPTYATSGIGTSIPAVRFTAASSQFLECDGLVTPFVGTDPSGTVIAVIKIVTTGASNPVFGMGAASATNTLNECYIHSNDTYRFFKSSDNGSSTTSIAVGTADTSAHVVTWRWTGERLDIRLDGATILSRSTITNVNLGANTCTYTKAALGSTIRASGNSYSDLNLGKTAIFSKAIGLDDVRWVEQWFGAWAVVTIS